MAKQQSDASRYPSRFAPDTWLSPQQFLAEYMCARQATAKGIDLPLYFWKQPQWEKAFKQQLRAANGLLKLYSPRAVSAALRSREGKRVLSLSAPWFDDLAKAEQHKLDTVEKITPPAEPAPLPPSGTPQMRPQFKTGQSLLDKLGDL